MGLIKKPDKKRHRVMKDPYAIALKKASKKHIRRARRLAADDQEVSRADRVVMEFNKANNNKNNNKGPDGKVISGDIVRNDSGNAKRRRRKKSKASSLLDSSKFSEAVEPYQPGMTKPLKPVPVHRQKPGETDKQFMERVRRTTWQILDQSRFEDKYEVDVWQDPSTGKVDLKSRKANTSRYKNEVEAELAEMKRLADADPSINKKRVKFGKGVKVADPVKKAEAEAEKEREGGKVAKKSRKTVKQDAPARKAVKERNRCKLLKARKKLKKFKSDGMEGLLEEDDNLGAGGQHHHSSSVEMTDEVGFGEVVSAPPLLEHKPRKATEKKTNRPGCKDLLLKKILEKAGNSSGKSLGSAAGSSGMKKASAFKVGLDLAQVARKRELEAERDRVMAAYKNSKRRKVTHAAPVDSDDD